MYRGSLPYQKSCINRFFESIYKDIECRIALCIIWKDGRTEHRFTKANRVENYISYLRHANAQGADIYFTPSVLKENKENQSRKRTKDNFEDFQSVIYLEFDTPVGFGKSVLCPSIFPDNTKRNSALNILIDGLKKSVDAAFLVC